MSSKVAAVLFAVLSAACASALVPPRAVPQSGESSGARLDGPGASAVPWSQLRRLSWDDFKGTAPPRGVEGAHTVYQLSYESRCRGEAFQFQVAAVFLPEQSWVKASVLTDRDEGARILQHEQTHFDLTEVYARRMRKYFAELYNPCGHTEAETGASIDRFVAAEAEAQKRYDTETSYGLAPARQQAWDREVGEMLADLVKFSS